MSELIVVSEHFAGEASLSDKRRLNTGLFFLIELDPTEVVDGVRTDAGYLTGDVKIAGEMREICPECNVHLQLVLRQKGVKRPHMFCEQCTRCFDACYPDGGSAFSAVF